MAGEYYLGLDVGTNSVGYAVTDKAYHLLKFKGEPMWGAHVFEDGENCAERRGFRTARRRLARRRQRIRLVQEIFAPEIARVDERFFIRLRESMLLREDVPAADRHIVFCDDGFTDKDYFHQYPTIHHLLCELMESEEPHDVRLVYLAVAWLVGHRGHFLNEMDKENLSAVTDFKQIYEEVRAYMEQNEIPAWGADKAAALQEILPRRQNISTKEKDLLAALYDGRKPKAHDEDAVSMALSVKLLAGGKVNAAKLFPQEDYDEKIEFSFADAEDKFDEVIAQLGEEGRWVMCLRRLYDWSLLKDVLKDEKTVSAGKARIYEQHRRDLRALKAFVRKYAPEKYAAIFRQARKKEKNYVAYSYHVKSAKGELPEKKASAMEFCDYLKKELKDISCRPEDEEFYRDMMQRLDLYTFMPKQVNGENRVIPYQLYYHELKMVLDKAAAYLPFLQEKDENGRSNREKILSIMSFRIPYFVGPLNGASCHAWIERRSEGPIYPWNFAERVDLDKSEEAFIRRMTNQCTYLPGEDVLPLHSLLYQKFMVLNEINPLKVNGMPITPAAKQKVYELFQQKRRVTKKAIRECLLRENYIARSEEAVLSGVDNNLHSSLKAYHDFRSLLEREALTVEQAEEIIRQLTYADDRKRIRDWLARAFPWLGEEDRKYIARLRYEDFGRLSRRFLAELKGVSRETGEHGTVMHFLWESNDNLMQLLSEEKYTFAEQVKKGREDYFAANERGTGCILDDLRVANAVRRSIYRTLDIVKDVCKAMGAPPKKIFLEMARGGGEKGKQTVSRRQQIEGLYKHLGKEYGNEVRELSQRLAGTSDNRLQSEAVYLYFMQLGRSMYSGTPIEIESLKDSSLYNVDHIYPRCYVKDDSLDNKVLVTSNENGAKGDRYPIAAEIREKMAGLWARYRKLGLISEKKYNRLIRGVAFTDEEKTGFIQRQLVETRQSAKALADIFQVKYPRTEVVYVKAGLVSDFRHEFDMLKCRSINDLHHAKDAYLNVVVGNVYHMRFSRQWFRQDEPYSLKTKTLFTHRVLAGKEEVWQGQDDIGRVRKVMAKNNIHYTRYAFERKGGFYDQTIYKKAAGLIPRKAGMDTEKYGGYNKATASFYLLASYALREKKPKRELMLVPVNLLAVDSIQKGGAMEYARMAIAGIIEKEADLIEHIEFPLGLRHIKINTMFSFDGFRACLGGKDSGGKYVSLKMMMPFIVLPDGERYIKRLESFCRKQKENKNLIADEQYDGITMEKNERLYDFLQQKMTENPYGKVKMIENLQPVIGAGKEEFLALSLAEQAKALLNILLVFQTGRSSPCDLSAIGGAKNAAVYRISSKLSNWQEQMKDARIIEQSASGLFCSRSRNLLEFL